MKRPLTTLIGFSVVIFLAYLWRKREGALGDFLEAVTGEPGPAEKWRDTPYIYPRSTPAAPGGAKRGGAKRGGIDGLIQKAEEALRRQENPNDPILDDTPVPGSPGTKPGGTWTPKWLYPNDSFLRQLEALRN